MLIEEEVQLGQRYLVLPILEDNLCNRVLHLGRLDSPQVFGHDLEVLVGLKQWWAHSLTFGVTMTSKTQ